MSPLDAVSINHYRQIFNLKLERDFFELERGTFDLAEVSCTSRCNFLLVEMSELG